MTRETELTDNVSSIVRTVNFSLTVSPPNTVNP